MQVEKGFGWGAKVGVAAQLGAAGASKVVFLGFVGLYLSNFGFTISTQPDLELFGFSDFGCQHAPQGPTSPPPPPPPGGS